MTRMLWGVVAPAILGEPVRACHSHANAIASGARRM